MQLKPFSSAAHTTRLWCWSDRAADTLRNSGSGYLVDHRDSRTLTADQLVITPTTTMLVKQSARLLPLGVRAMSSARERAPVMRRAMLYGECSP